MNPLRIRKLGPREFVREARRESLIAVTTPHFAPPGTQEPRKPLNSVGAYGVRAWVALLLRARGYSIHDTSLVLRVSKEKVRQLLGRARRLYDTKEAL